eukprot:CAMPEP_0119105290 /NCGR_PEP_ID=MMETSP1180-20130426/3294_1 /TAXON_ID=3052 ORGANISM="Chlamydomonas cf sp, Strain CCMP681" /NCGR_SAMPLE_ID=MMETSP1180 /ASSEMBLY_ACC=CAM_ASM_000741 /LENGTH=343 /DNA_ID=CAMNT_0007090301 /DNA_START=6 /DNA_END=1037 /DNA_ORIENTATION=-
MAGIAMLVTAAASVGITILLIARPRGAVLELESFPSCAWLYTQAIMSLMLGKSKKARAGPRMLKVSLMKPTPINPERFAGFVRLTAAGGEGGGSTAGLLPLCYPMCEGFRLVMQCMFLPEFPFNVLGSVLTGNKTVCYRAIGCLERLLYSVSINLEDTSRTAKGDTEVPVVLTVYSGEDREVVLLSTITVLVMNPNRNKGAKADAIAPLPAPAWVPIDTWRLGSDVGRRFASLNGDRNPIHMFAFASALFGFKRPIAHALYLTACAEASLISQGGVVPSTPCLLDAAFKRPTLLPATLQLAWMPPALVTGEPVKLGSEGVKFAVLTAIGSKEVLVGSWRAGSE